MTNHYFEKIFDPVHRFLDSSVGRADGFKAESCGSNLTLLKLFFSYFSKNFMTKKNILLAYFFTQNLLHDGFRGSKTSYNWDLCLKTF